MNKLIIACLLVLATFFAYAVYETGQVGGKLMAGGGDSGKTLKDEFSLKGADSGKTLEECGFAKSSEPTNGGYADVDGMKLAKSYDPEPEPFANVNFGVESGTKALFKLVIGGDKPKPSDEFGFKDVVGTYRDECSLKDVVGWTYNDVDGMKLGIHVGGSPLYLTSVGPKPPKANLGVHLGGNVYLEDEHRQPKPYLEGQDGFKPTKIYLEEGPGGFDEHPWQDSG